MQFNTKFNWISSTDENNGQSLRQLNKNMTEFYRSSALREGYNKLIQIEDQEKPSDEVTKRFIEWIEGQEVNNIIEIGCGSGRIWNWLNQINKEWMYTGIEVDEKSIQQNKQNWPHQAWYCSSVYDINLTENSFDICYSFYVLEHLVFPVKALEKMFGLLKTGGHLVLIFPDFSQTMRLPSQLLGSGVERTTLSKLKKWKVIDALKFWLNSRRLEKKLAGLEKHAGKFLVNLTPACLYYGHQQMWSDIDAVYIAQKAEIHKWGENIGAIVDYPFGRMPPFDEHAFMVITKL